MYIPKHFQWQETEEIRNFLHTYPFATLVVAENQIPTASHLPFLLEGETLITHLSKVNPHAKVQHEQPALVIFQTPHAYISPTLYDSTPNVPTWNYLAVHVYGKIQLVEESEAKKAILEKLMPYFEPNYRTWWDKMPEKYLQGMLNGMTGMTISIEKVEAKAKMSQNKTLSSRENVKEYLAKHSDAAAQTMAEWMEKLG
ncbi:MAG: FMN-binding negative transcriptional regulator [Bacteroidia bacterium]